MAGPDHTGLVGQLKEEFGSYSEYDRKPVEHFSQRSYVLYF